MDNPSSPFPDDNGSSASLRPHLEAACKGLNLRIARLAMGLGVSLDREAEVERVLHHRAPAAGAPAKHQEAQWIELRLLLLLRDELEKRCVDELGPAAARDVLVEIEAEMARRGFRQGADGLDLQRLFGTEAAMPALEAAPSEQRG